jgi:HlyD family secretion protein
MTGTVEKIHVREGDRVVAGQLLLEMETKQLKSRIREVRIAIALLSIHQGMAARIALDRARIEEKRARKELENLRQLVYSDLATPEEREQKKFRVDLAANRVQEATNQLRQLGLEETAKREQLARLTRDLENHEIRAPQDGVLTRVHLDHAGELVSAGTPLFDVDNVDKLIVRARVDELDARTVRPGQKVDLRWKGDSKVLGKGTVTYRAPRVDRDRDHSYVEVHVTLDDNSGRFLVGNNVMVEILIEERKDTLLIPSDAVQVREDRLFVQILLGGKIRNQSVQIGVSDPDRIEIREGLSEGDLVLLSGKGEVLR